MSEIEHPWWDNDPSGSGPACIRPSCTERRARQSAQIRELQRLYDEALPPRVLSALKEILLDARPALNDIPSVHFLREWLQKQLPATPLKPAPRNTARWRRWLRS